MRESFVHPNDKGGVSAKKGNDAVNEFLKLCDSNNLHYEQCSEDEDKILHRDWRVEFPAITTKNLPLGNLKVDVKSTKSNRRYQASAVDLVCLEVHGSWGDGWIKGNDDENLIAFHLESKNLFYLISVKELKAYLDKLQVEKVIDMDAKAQIKTIGDYENFGIYRRSSYDKRFEKFMYVPLEHLLSNVKHFVLD